MANSSTNPTFEEVDKHFQSADLSAFQPGGKHHISGSTAVSPAAAIPNVCAIYKVVRPFLVLASNLPLLPQKWRDAIKLFIQAMDSFCP
jgi:hypothetical protein